MLWWPCEHTELRSDEVLCYWYCLSLFSMQFGIWIAEIKDGRRWQRASCCVDSFGPELVRFQVCFRWVPSEAGWWRISSILSHLAWRTEDVAEKIKEPVGSSTEGQGKAGLEMILGRRAPRVQWLPRFSLGPDCKGLMPSMCSQGEKFSWGFEWALLTASLRERRRRVCINTSHLDVPHKKCFSCVSVSSPHKGGFWSG